MEGWCGWAGGVVWSGGEVVQSSGEYKVAVPPPSIL